MITAHSPKWSDATNTSIDLVATFPWLDVEVSFSASPNDLEVHGRDLYARALSGEFGPIAEYQPPILTPEQVTAKIKFEALRYLASTDWYVIRHQETGKEIPADILAARQAARDSIK